MSADLQRTPLYDLHVELGAKMVPFAGYAMPVNYPGGIIAEHRQCRESAALFDVSHMGQLRLVGADAAAALESLVPVDVIDLPVGKQRYALFTNASGGILDDLMIARRPNDLFVVVNAACKDADTQHLSTNLGHRCQVLPMPERALLALQGQKAVKALARLADGVTQLTFMTGGTLHAGRRRVLRHAQRLHRRRRLRDFSAGRRGGRSSPGNCSPNPRSSLPGSARATRCAWKPACACTATTSTRHTTPVEAGLTWAIQKVRRPGGARAGHYPGADKIAGQMATGVQVKRVGLVGLERIPVREGAILVDAQGHKLGHVTSGTLAPTVNQPIAMAYLAANHAIINHEVYAEVRGKRQPMRVTALPFVPPGYVR